VFSEVSVTGETNIELGRLLRFSIPVFLVGFSNMALDQTDRLILGFLRSSSQVGLYNAAYILSQQTLIFFTAMMTMFNPIVSDLYSQGNTEELQEVYSSATRWILIVSLPVVVVGSLFAPELLSIFNDEFSTGGPLLLILFFAQLIFVTAGPASEVLVMSDHQDLVLIDTVAMLVANVVLNFALIPEFGPIGAAIATMLTITGIQIVQVYQTARHVGVFPFDRTYLRLVTIGAGFVALGSLFYVLSFPLLPRIGLVVVTTGFYALSVWTFAVTDEDVQMLKSAI
jgi:O-antigen/teichoic acid export membrane protein